MSYLSNEQKAIYAVLADNVYWDIRHGMNSNPVFMRDEENLNWTPITSITHWRKTCR